MTRNRLAATFITACLLATGVCAADDPRAPLHVTPDGRYLALPDGSPFFWLGDTGWAIFQRLDRPETEEYLADRAAKGFTIIQAVAMGGPFDRLDNPNRAGELALIDKDPTRPNPRYFEHIDWAVDRAAQHGLRIAMLPTWGASIVGGFIDDGTQRIFDERTAEIYGRWLGERYRGKGIVWILGGDTNPLGVAAFRFQKGATVDRDRSDMRILDYRPIYDAMARGLAAGEGGKPFITYHLTCCSWSGTPKPQTSAYLGDRSWLTINMLQSSHFRHPGVVKQQLGVDFAWDGTANYEAVKAEYDAVPTRPVVDGEPRYEGLPVNVQYNKATGHWTGYDARNAAYHALFAGAAGHTFGNNAVHQSHDPARHGSPQLEAVYPGLKHWRAELDSEGARSMRHVKALMLSRPYFTRIPDQSVLATENATGEDYIGATRDAGGRYAMVYSPKGKPFAADMSRVSGSRAIAWWFDPRTGQATRIKGNFPTKGARSFTPPSSGATEDWVLVIDDAAEGFEAPGSKALESK
jgi:hypothetical protein